MHRELPAVHVRNVLESDPPYPGPDPVPISPRIFESHLGQYWGVLPHDARGTSTFQNAYQFVPEVHRVSETARRDLWHIHEQYRQGHPPIKPHHLGVRSRFYGLWLAGFLPSL